MDRIIGGKYKLGRKIGSGSCGDVYEATQIGTSELVAVKIEKGDTRHSHLMLEAMIYDVLQGKCGIPKIMWSGKDSGNNILVLELLGPNLQSLLEQCGGKFTKKTILMLAVQMIGRIEYMHSKGFLHRDIKPENFVMGVGERRHQVFIIDFGLAMAYLDPITNRHIRYRRVKSIVGTPRYASCNTYYLHEQSRRDDLLSLGYVLLYFLKGRLPWQDLGYLSEEPKRAMIGPMKLTFHKFFSELLPTGLASYFRYCKGLKFDQTPDYGFLKNLFHDWYTREGYRLDGYFDWTSFKYQRAKRTTASPRLFRRAKLPPPEPTIPDVPIMHEASSHVQSQPLPLLHDHESSIGSLSRQTRTV